MSDQKTTKSDTKAKKQITTESAQPVRGGFKIKTDLRAGAKEGSV
jgi:hypothetical protein